MNFFDNFVKVDVKKNIGITGITDEFFCLYLNCLMKQKKKNILVVVNSLFEANNLYSSLATYTNNVYLFPMDDFLTSEAIAISPDLKINRLGTLNILNFFDDNFIVITNLMGYLRFLPTKENYVDSVLHLSVGDEITPKLLVEKLLLCGYSKDTIVTNTGDIGVRGFVIDVFPIDFENPVRLEFFGDQIESIRFFDAKTQKSLSNIQDITICPYTEFLCKDFVESEIFGKQKYLPNYADTVSISEYFSNGFVVFKDYEQLLNNYNIIHNEMDTYRNEKDFDFDGKYMYDFSSIKNSFCLYYMSLNNLRNNFISEMIDYDVRTINNFNEDIDQINKFLRKCIKDNKTVIICLKDYQVKSLTKKLTVNYVISNLDTIKFNCVNFVNLDVTRGFIFDNIVVLSSNELFIFKEKKKRYNNKFKYSSAISDMSKLSVGDYVVHNIHGIGIYNGIKTLTSCNIAKDYLEILYQGADKVYIPVEKIDLLSKYSGKDGVVPKVNKLGGNDWEKTKARVRKKIDGIADKLLELYAARESMRGHAFSKDNSLSVEFSRAFSYALTEDQKRAITQIKADMESSVPMDRLLCGDVGFGKTEVAFEAAFKAIIDSKQVLFLCPTTILSSQHYKNAKVRFADFPVSIALLNRFTSPKEVSVILDGLANGTIDLVFGTHRLLSDDVKVKDLGLLIIDEEQRFGVMHKEKIKEYKSMVDVLTLTATPIPRTLQMSLVGIRSLSLIETPPVNRYPVQTYVIEENNQVIRSAIEKELSRKGQIYILYNRVNSIQDEYLKICSLVPDARVTVAHGQMNKQELESKILDFINYEYDILICTTIIETGIDIPNVNTLIIIDADTFGLSQLYQIRGRVGRSDRFAYAYLMYNPGKILTDNAHKRLNVIKEFTELGSGFSIATRDLSIRGAGDILGSEQAGFIDSVGIDLFLKMLSDEIEKRKGNVISDDLSLDSKPLLSVSTHIDNNYVDNDDLKIEIHRKINEIDSKQKFDSIKSELEDRFGKLDENLIIYMYEEWFEKLSIKLGVKRVNQNRNFIEVVFSSDVLTKYKIDEIFVEAFKISNMFRFMSKGDNLVIILDTIRLEKHPIYYLVELFDKILELY